MREELSRTELLMGSQAMENLQNARVAVFGVGGVGGYVVEALARSGVGALDLIDSDTVNLSNINRQIIATHSTVGKYKVDVMKERIADINPECRVNVFRCFFLPENKDEFDFTHYTYVVDAVDTVTAKIQLVMQAKEAGVPVISSMGAGNKLNPAAFEVADIYKTSVCPLAKVMRRELKKRGVKELKVVYSREEAIRPLDRLPEDEEQETTTAGVQEKAAIGEDSGMQEKTAAGEGREAQETETAMEKAAGAGRRSTPGSVAFVPSVVGLIIASEVIKDIAGR